MNSFGYVVEPRVGQLDASLLDGELLEQLKNKLWDAFKIYHPEIKDRYEAELLVALRLALFKLTVWDHSATYGARLQGLRLVSARTSKPASKKQRIAYGAITILGSYFWHKLDEYIATASYDSTDDPAVARVRLLLDRLHAAWTGASLINFVVFLYSGRYSTLILRLLGMKFAATSKQQFRNVNYEFQNRQLVWNALTEFLLFVVPLVNFARLRRRAARLLGFSAGSTNTGRLNTLPDRVCAICYEQDTADPGVTNPYVGECGHAYCYVCLSLKTDSDPDGWPCLRCAKPIKTIRPF